MQIDHDEIMRRAAAISPTLSAHAARVRRRPQAHRRKHGRRRQRRHVPDSATATGARLRAESAHTRRRRHLSLRGVPLERLGADGDGRASLVHGLVSGGGAGRSLWRWPRWPGRGNVVIAGQRNRGRWGLSRRRAVAILQRRRSCSLGNPGMRRSLDAPAFRPRRCAARRARSGRHLARDGPAGDRQQGRRQAHDVFVPAHRAIDTRILFRGASPHAANHATNLYRLSAEAMLSVSVSTAVLGSAKFALLQFIERTKERRVILTGARKADHGPTQVRLAEAAAEIQSRGSVDSRHPG